MNSHKNRDYRFRALIANLSDLDNYVVHLQSVIGPNTIIKVVRGHRMHSKELLLDEFAAAFQFPLYFGRNWDAFDECMSDLQSLCAKEYHLIIAEAGALLKIEPEDLVIFFEILDRVSQEWSEGDVPMVNVQQEGVRFHIVLQDSRSNIEELRQVLLPIVGDIPNIEG